MIRWWMMAVLVVACIPAAWAQDADGDGMSDATERALGTNPAVAEQFTQVYEDKAKGDGDETVGADLQVAHDLVTVSFASVAKGRGVWRLDFTEPWVVRGDVALIVYIDADNDPDTGRQGGGTQGTDVMLRPEAASNYGLAATLLQASAAEGNSLYMALDAPVNVVDGEAVMRAYVLIQNRQTLTDNDRTPGFDVRAPASDAEAVAMPEGHSMYRAPEVIERVRARMPVDSGGTQAIITWITSWPTGSVVQYGPTAAYTELVRLDDPEQNHRVVLEGLAPGGTYHYRVRARGGAGELISGDDLTFSTDVHEPAGSVGRWKVPLRVSGAPGDSQLVTQGVPFPQGVLGGADHVRMLDAAGDEVPAQVAVTSRWPDDSVKWVLADFQADLRESGKASYALEFGTQVTRAPVPHPIQVTEADDAITVDTGALRARLDRRDFRLLGDVCLDLNGDGRITDDERVTDPDGCGIFLTALDGEQFTSLGAPEVLEVERRGPMHTVILARGHHLSEANQPLFAYEVRLHFYAGRPTVRVFHTFENDAVGEQFATIKSLELRLPLAGGNTGGSLSLPGGGAAALGAGQQARLVQSDDQRCRLEAASGDIPDPQRAPGVVDVTGARCGVTVAVRNFWQLWPKSIGTDERGVVVGIMPDLPEDEYAGIDHELEDKLYFALMGGVYKLHRGVSKTHELLVRFHPSGEAGPALDQLATQCNVPPLAAAAPQWYAYSEAFWQITPRVE
ncbi:MAG TPA: fibronectin type III domain-containing protein, partial [Armatimonadota bacterium]|nr:fibronectin type III domain-containing protein [Armatimonadota bacterium]